jgi:hypothetical protein
MRRVSSPACVLVQGRVGHTLAVVSPASLEPVRPSLRARRKWGHRQAPRFHRKALAKQGVIGTAGAGKQPHVGCSRGPGRLRAVAPAGVSHRSVEQMRSNRIDSAVGRPW